MNVENVVTPALGRSVVLRTDGSDRQVWQDTFTGLYHVPPAEMTETIARAPRSPVPWPRTVLDAGCNIGLTAAHYSALWPWTKIVAVDLDHENVILASRNAPRAQTRHCAVAGEPGIRHYRRAALAEAYQLTDPDTPVDACAVAAVTLREVIVSELDNHADLVKLDVEGAEWEILAHPDWAPYVGSLLIELHPIQEMPNDSDYLVDLALSILHGLGFHAERHAAHPRAVWAVRVS